MENSLAKADRTQFYGLKLAKKRQLTKNTYALELEVPSDLKEVFRFQAGQYVPIKLIYDGVLSVHDYSMTSAPYEGVLELGIKINSQKSAANAFLDMEIGQIVEVGKPQGRFTLISKPHEFRTILGFAAGIGITPILSHFKNILHQESRTRLFLFYGNKTSQEIAFKEELDDLVTKYPDRLQVFHFLSQEELSDSLLKGRLDAFKLKLIINQILHLDDTDEESTIWDSVDEVLICGKGEMIKSLANACFDHGIPKKNIHFELFQEFNEDIYPQEEAFPLIENIEVDFKLMDEVHHTTFDNNETRLLQKLLIQGFPVPYSCKSGICGVCQCKIEEGKVELLENEYLTEKEEEEGYVLACMSVVMSEKVKVNFDSI